MGRHAVAAPRGSNEKVWPPCSFSNKEPSKTTERLPPRLANNSNRSLQGRRLLWGFMLRACLRLCGMHACFGADSCSEAYMTLCACSCRACLCLCCLRARACPGICHGDKGDSWNSRATSKTRWSWQDRRGGAEIRERGGSSQAGGAGGPDGSRRKSERREGLQHSALELVDAEPRGLQHQAGGVPSSPWSSGIAGSPVSPPALGPDGTGLVDGVRVSNYGLRPQTIV